MATFQDLEKLVDRFLAFKSLLEAQQKYLEDSDWEQTGDGSKWEREDGEVMTQEQAVKEQMRVDQRALLESTFVLGEAQKE